MDKTLQSRLHPAMRRHRAEALGWRLAAVWGGAALVGWLVGWGESWTGAFAAAAPLLAALALGATTVALLRHRAVIWDYRAVAREIERRHPDLNGVLLTAVQQPVGTESPPGFFQQQLLDEALAHSQEHDWRRLVPRWRLLLAQLAPVAAGALLVLAFTQLQEAAGPEGRGPWRSELAVTPGDTSIERGESLVVLARFGVRVPAEVTLVVRSSGSAARRIPLVKSLADPVFGGGIPELDHDLTYRLEYTGGSTREFKVTVFEHPRVERADAVLTYPAYTRLAQKRIENTRRISAVEGTRLDLTLQLNKPIASGQLVAHDAKKTVLPLQVTAGQAVARLPAFALAASQSYDVQLLDREGRSNRATAPFVIVVTPDRPPEVHVATPRGDVRPSPVEEIGFAGTVLGDFGVSAYGLTYTVAGAEPKVIELGHAVPAREKRPFSYTLHLEDLGVRPDQLISWYLWADDAGPDGQARRTNGDLFFAEIRPFEEIFRESKAMQSPEEQGGPGGGDNDSQRLAELQKQIISATWKLQRDPAEPKYPADAKVVQDSQAQALTQAAAGKAKAEDPRAEGLWTAAMQAMSEARSHLAAAAQSPPALGPALSAEQAAYQSLLRLQSRETQVARGRRGGGGRGGASQREMEQLDLTQEQNRYETQREAAPAESPERREQLQVMNRLQELARRQQDVNDRLKEMQTALQEARTEQQREDIRRQLKRLEDEQQQMLADVDELQQRLDRQENQTTLNEQRQQLEQTRRDVQRAAEAAGQGRVPEALAAGTRAQRQFQEMRDRLHQQNSSQFSDDLRDMRSQARELAQREEEIGRRLNPETGGGEQRKRLSDAAESGGPAAALDEQQKRLAALVDRAKQVSQQAESSEPLLAEKLYDSLRKLGQDDAGTVKEFQQDLLNKGLLTYSLNQRLTDTTGTEGTKSLDLASALVRQGYLPQAGEAEQRARAGIDELRQGVERAAESVIGDDTAALKLAQSELDSVTDQLRREAAEAPAPGENSGQPRPSGTPSENRTAGQPGQPGQSGQSGQPGQGGAQPPATAASSPAGGPSPGGGAPASGADLMRQLAQAAPGQEQPGANPPAGGDAVNGGGGSRGASPLTGGGYGAWSDRLRDVEEIVDAPALRNAVAAARERARLLRQDYTKNLQRPDWAVIQREVMNPLVEVRNQISDELARRDSKESLAPIDRDPVPTRYAESVRKYYEDLGKDK